MTNRLKSRSKEKLNDNKWHLVTVWRSTRTSYELTVDALVVRLIVNGTVGERTSFGLVDRLYVGGLRNDSEYVELRQKGKIASKHGYMGCMASIEINGRVPDFDDILNVYNRMNGNITKGCECKMSLLLSI